MRSLNFWELTFTSVDLGACSPMTQVWILTDLMFGCVVTRCGVLPLKKNQSRNYPSPILQPWLSLVILYHYKVNSFECRLVNNSTTVCLKKHEFAFLKQPTHTKYLGCKVYMRFMRCFQVQLGSCPKLQLFQISKLISEIFISRTAAVKTVH